MTYTLIETYRFFFFFLQEGEDWVNMKWNLEWNLFYFIWPLRKQAAYKQATRGPTA